MTEVMTEVPGSGTRLKIEGDRPWDRHAGDSVLRVLGHSPDGEPVFEAAYVEIDREEGMFISALLRSLSTPSVEMRDHIAQDVHALFGAKLSGRDAAQIAQTVARAQWDALAEEIGTRTRAREGVNVLAERFERVTATIQSPRGASAEGDGKTTHKNGGGH